MNRSLDNEILIIAPFFGVGTAPTGGILESAACGLFDAGWQVEVLTSSLTYNAQIDREQLRFRGKVHRFQALFRDATGVMGRLLAWANFLAGVFCWMCFHPLPGKVLVQSNPPFVHVLLVLRNLVARILGRGQVQIILWNQDTYPDILAATHIMSPNHFVYRLLRWVLHHCIRRVDRVIALDGSMALRLREQGARHVAVLNNWEVEADTDSLAESTFEKAPTKFRYSIIYTGNYGWGHDLTLLERYLEAEPGQTRFRFVFIGGGVKWPSLSRLWKLSTNNAVQVMDYQPRETMLALVRQADFGLVALQSGCAGMMSPSKTHTYLAHGKPILYLGPAGSNVAEAIEAFNCGIRIRDDDDAGWWRMCAELDAVDFAYEKLCANARRAHAMRYCESAGVQAFLQFMQV